MFVSRKVQLAILAVALVVLAVAMMTGTAGACDAGTTLPC